MIFHALLVGQHSSLVKLIGPHRGKKFPAMFGNQIFRTILTRGRHMYSSCMDGSCREAGESRPYPPILPHKSSFILLHSSMHIILPFMSQLPVQWLPGGFSEGKVAGTVA